MNLIFLKMFFSFPGLFFFGINPHQQKKDKPSDSFKEVTEAYSKK